MNNFECTNELKDEVTNQTEAFLLCLNYPYNSTCPIVTESEYSEVEQ